LFKLLGQIGGQFQGKATLADPARAGDSEQAGLIQDASRLRQFFFTADKFGNL
jgi:hypothetical protein